MDVVGRASSSDSFSPKNRDPLKATLCRQPSSKCLSPPPYRIDKATKVSFLADHLGIGHLAEVDKKMDSLFDELLEKKFSSLQRENEEEELHIEEHISDLLLTKSGKLHIALIPALQDYLRKKGSSSNSYLIQRLALLMKDLPLQNELEKRWSISEKAVWITLENRELLLKRNIIALLLSHPRQRAKHNCFAFSVAWSIFSMTPQKMVSDLREIAEKGGLQKKRGQLQVFFPFLRAHEPSPAWRLSENHPFFEIWSSVLASMAEGSPEGIITSAIVNSILYQAEKFLRTDRERRTIPVIKKALLNRIYVGYDPYAFNNTGGFILYDHTETFSAIDTLDKFSNFIVEVTQDWIGKRLDNRKILRDLLSTFHHDHKNLTPTLRSARTSKHTPWACDSGNDPTYIIQNYFELKKSPCISSCITPAKLRELYGKILEVQELWKKRLPSECKGALIPMRIVGKHTCNLIISPQNYIANFDTLRSKGLLIFADTNWDENGKDLFWAFTIDGTGAPKTISEVNPEGEIHRVLLKNDYKKSKWEFFLPPEDFT